MKFTVERKDFIAAVKSASATISNRHIPMLGCLHIAAGDGLTITGTDMVQSVQAKCAASVPTAGVAAVNADMLGRWLGAMDAGNLIYCESDEANLSLSSGRASIAIPSLNPAEFPEVSFEGGIEVVGALAAFRTCLPFADKPNGARFYLEGVFFGSGFAVATTGQILHSIPVDTAGATGIVPHLASRAILAASPDARLFLGERTWLCESEFVKASGSLIEGAFPDWKRLCGTISDFGSFDADAAIDAINAATLGTARQVILSSSDGVISAAGEGWPSADSRTRNEFAYDGDDFTCAFQSKNILAALAPHAGSVVTLGCNGSALSLKSGDAVSMAYPWRDQRTSLPQVKVAA